MRIPIICLCLAALATPRLDARDESGNKPEPANSRAWLVCAQIPDELDNPLMVVAGGETVEVTLSKRSPSEPVRIPPDGILRVVRPTEQPDAAGEKEFQTLAEARIPDDVLEALVILMPVARQTDGRLFEARVQDLAGFRGGDWLYLNLTHLEVRVEMDGTRLRVDPRQYEIFDTPDNGRIANVPISYSYYDPGRQQWNKLGASTVVLNPTRREILIFSIDPRSERITSHGITFPVSD